jgi:hypothetical protein
LLPGFGIFSNIAGKDNGVGTALVDHIDGLSQILGGMGRAFLAQMSIADLRDGNLRRRRDCQ